MGEPQWPPRSPYEAAISSPSGRRKISQRQDRLSPSPSPLKRASNTPNLQRRQHLAPPAMDDSNGVDNDEDEDEEMLQLRLEAIQAKLKLKKLQSKKAARDPSAESTERHSVNHVQPSVARDSSHRSVRTVDRRRDNGRANGIQVPLSPERPPPIQEQRSPSRVAMGIDKGLSAKNVSLRRVPSQRTTASSTDDPFTDNHHAPSSRGTSCANGPSGIKSFNERSLGNGRGWSRSSENGGR